MSQEGALTVTKIQYKQPHMPFLNQCHVTLFTPVLSFNPGTCKLMTGSNDSAAVVETNEPAIAEVDARGIIKVKKKGRKVDRPSSAS